MDTSEIGNQVKEAFEALKEKFEENSLYNNVKDRYESFSPFKRKIVIFTSVFFVVFLLLLFPMMNINSSFSSEETYKENLSVIKDLIKYGSRPKSESALPIGGSPERLVEELRSQLEGESLLPEQIVEVSNQSGLKKIVKGSIRQSNVKVSLKWLNLTQVVDIGYKFQKIKSNVKLLGLEIREDVEKENYFNVNYEVASFSLPPVAAEPSKKKRPSRKGKRK